jgi:Protein of unknown function (DUF4007)
MEYVRTNYRISGHESFACRYAWLPKIAYQLRRDNRILADELRAMVALGLGKNMVRSVRFWAQAAGIAVTEGRTGRYLLTDFATNLLDEGGLDPFLEDIRTLWLIHWKLATSKNAPLLAWDYLINNWHEPEITPSVVISALKKETLKQGDELSTATITGHFETFLHTYIPTRSRKGEILEDNLDCPLVELEFLVQRGELEMDAKGKRESVYAFNRDWKPEITPALFIYSLNAFWDERHAAEEMLSFREVAHGHASPGQIFKLPEEDVRARLENLNRTANSPFSYSESVNLQQVRRHRLCREVDLLKQIYRS